MLKYVSSLLFVSLVGCVGLDEAEDLDETELVEELGSQPDLTVALGGPSGAVGGRLADITVTLTNSGGASAAAGKVTIALPPTASLYSSPLCTYGSTVSTFVCNFGTVPANATRITSAKIAMPVAPTATFNATASTTTQESSTQNNTGSVTVSLAAPAPPVPVTIGPPQNIATRACNGTVPSFAGCRPGSFVNGTWTLDTGGGVLYGGSPIGGTWTQPGGPGSLKMEFRNTNGVLIIRYELSAVSNTCFWGLMYQGAATSPYGAIEACYL